MGVFGLEAGGGSFLPHSPQKCVSSITQYSPHATSPTMMVGVHLLCKMSDSLLLLFFSFFCRSAHLQGHSSTESSEFLVEKWCATLNLTYMWRRGWVLMLESRVCTKKHTARRSVFEGSSHCPILEPWVSTVLHNVRAKEGQRFISSSCSCCFQSM